LTFEDGALTVVVVVDPEGGCWGDELVVVLVVGEVTFETGVLCLDGLCSVKTPKKPTTVAPPSENNPFMSPSSQML
jgi:hypothetical protein